MTAWLPSRRRLAAGAAVALLGPIALALGLVPLRDHVDGAVVGLAMLLPTALGTALGGPPAAVVAVIVGSLTHNLLFTRPYLTLRVADTTDVVGLVVHTVVAVAVSLVVVREQRAAQLAATREEEAARLRVLAEVDRARTALLGAVSHDLRTPLAAIAAAASDLQATDVTFSERDRGILAATIVEQTARLDRIVANLLDAGRLQAGAVTLAVEPVEVDEVVAEAVAGLAAEGAARVRVTVAPATPPLLVDPMLIVAALRNLLDNALRHGPDGSPVEVAADGAGNAVVLTVRDHGAGLGDAPPDQVFEPFWSATGGGSGLGLAICRGFVEAHGGEVRAGAPDDGEGAVFELVLPAAQEPET